jgi:hypothetical protein
MNALDVIARQVTKPFFKASTFTLDELLGNFDPAAMPLMLQTTMGMSDTEPVDSSFQGYVWGLYLRNSVVFACLAIRTRLFSQVRFAFQQMRNGQPGQLFGTPALRILEHPEGEGSTTSAMLAKALVDADLGADAFLVRRPAQDEITGSDTIRRLRPDWTTTVYGSKKDRGYGMWDPDADIVGYGHVPGGFGAGGDVIAYGADEVAHFVSTHHPLARNHGMSLLTAGISEVRADTMATNHKLSFFRNGATVNLVVNFPPEMDSDTADEWIEKFEAGHRGALSAYKTLYLGGGPTATPVGSNMKDMTFSELQGKAETRIAALTGMNAIVTSLSEGLQGSALNVGNAGQARRNVADQTLWPLWGDICGALERIVPPPPGSRLWIDPDVPFLREDLNDQAEIITKNVTAIGQAIKDGFEPDSAVDAVISGDLSRLVHTGLVSVQLQAPGTQLPKQVARAEFWPLSGRAQEVGIIPAGTELDANHPIVRMFPSMFEAKSDTPVVVRTVPQLTPRAKSEPVVTREAVLAKRAELEAAGLDAGRTSLARALLVSESTIKRRLAEDE